MWFYSFVYNQYEGVKVVKPLLKTSDDISRLTDSSRAITAVAAK